MARVWRNRFSLLSVALLPVVAAAQAPAPGFADSVLGRWDLSIEDPAGNYPSWLELRLRTETELMGRFVGRVGSVRHLARIDYRAGALTFEVPVQYERRASPLVFEAKLIDAELIGTTVDADGAVLDWIGTRAPPLRSSGAPVWGPAIALFNGRDLDGWRPRSAERPGCWRVESGELVAVPPCIDLISEQTFDDFRLHVELEYPEGSNSGVYLRGRYEVQIQDDAGRALDPLRSGGLYGFLAPTVAAALPANRWQTLDVTLLGRTVTVVLNGQTIIDAQEIPGITGGALDSDECAPGPIMLQGDHGPIRFRNLSIARRQ